MKRALRQVLPLRFGLLNLALTILALGYIWHFSQKNNGDVYEHDWQLIGSLIVTVISVNLGVQLVLSLGARRCWRRIVLGTGYLLVTVCLLSYHLESGTTFDPSVVIDMHDVPLSWNVLLILTSSLDTNLLLAGMATAIVFFWIDKRWSWCYPEQPGPAWRNVLFTAAALFGLFQCPFFAYDEVSELVGPFVRLERRMQVRVSVPPGKFPLVHETPQGGHKAAGQHPKKIFVIMVESFNANVVEANAPNGLPYTPYFNSLIPKGLYVDKFYGNSVQTAKGHFATFCSLIPSANGPEYARMADKHLHCLPEILKDAGYLTLFFQAHDDVNYDNTSGFLKRNGFELVETVADHKRKEDESKIWGWGLQDDVFYRRFFEYLDGVYSGANADKSLFVALAPISNHMRFDKVPPKERRIYEEPSNTEECFANSVNVADRGLEVFFRELRRRERFQDALVIVTGDHSFPIGEHGYDHNEAHAYEEFFRIPFVMVAPGQIEPERVHDTPFSQLDIAPTLLEYTGIRPERNHFLGVSVLTQPRQKHAIPIVQPYAGHYLGIIDYPYKYLFRTRGEQARLYNLAKDPHEQHNLVDNPEQAARRSRLHRLLQVHYLNDLALKKDQVWPETKDRSAELVGVGAPRNNAPSF